MERTKKLKYIRNKLNEIKECLDKIKRIKSLKMKSQLLNKLLYLKIKGIKKFASDLLKDNKAFIIQKIAKIVCGSRKKSCKPKTEKESKDDIIKHIRNHFKLKEENKAIKDKIIRDIRNLP